MRGLLVGVVLVTAACYMRGSPGAGITPDIASEWGCSIAAVQAGSDSMKEKSAGDRLPKTGWTACDVMAAAGNPDSTAVARSGGETTATWCFQNHAGAVVRQVILVKKDEQWIVQAATRWHEMSTAAC